jgi:hypothetical protein
MRTSINGLLVLLLLSAPSAAQTIDETLLFMFFGSEPPQDARFVRRGNCQYELHRSFGSAKEVTRFDFNKLYISIAGTHDNLLLKLEGENAMCEVGATVCPLGMGIPTKAPLDRLRRAIAYFKEQFCRGSAF